jgi:hypothetical protein
MAQEPQARTRGWRIRPPRVCCAGPHRRQGDRGGGQKGAAFLPWPTGVGAGSLLPAVWRRGRDLDLRGRGRGFGRWTLQKWGGNFEFPDTQGAGAMLDSRPNVASGIDWAFAPDWLTIEQACFLSGHDRGAM